MNNTEKHAYAQREKVYLQGNIYPDLRVGMQSVHLTPTVTIKNDERIVTENEPVYIYDTGGPFTDPSMSADYTKGITKIREPWIKRRAKEDPSTGSGTGAVKTQLAYAKEGIITEEMEYVAIRENMNIDKLGIKTHITPEFVCSEIAAGRAVLPANINHPEAEPMIIGRNFLVKINTNIGRRSRKGCLELQMGRRYPNGPFHWQGYSPNA